MQLQLMQEAVQFILKLDGRAIKDILADVRVDEDSKVLASLSLAVLGSCSETEELRSSPSLSFRSHRKWWARSKFGMICLQGTSRRGQEPLGIHIDSLLCRESMPH